MITQELDLNMVPGTVPPVINVSQFDTGARTFKFTLYNGATLFNGTVASCRIEGIKPDGKGFSYNASYSNGVITADCTEQMTAIAGNVLCEIRLQETDEKSLGTLNFTLCVEKSPINEDTDFSQTEIPALVDLARSHEKAAAASAEQAANSATHVDAVKAEMQAHLDQIDQNTTNISGLRTDVDKLRTDVDKNIVDIGVLRTDVDNKLNRPSVNPCGNSGQLLASNGDGTNSNKWVNLDDILRDSPLIRQIIDMIISESSVLTVAQGNLTVSQGHIKVRHLS